MQIILGFELDGGSYPDALGDTVASVGKVVTGPKGLVSILETRMGLSRPLIHEAVRIGQYFKRLNALDNGVRFYSESLKVDAWSVAKQILEWRDELISNGWRADTRAKAGNRLSDLSEIEKLEQLDLAPGLADRLFALTETLKSTKNTDISEIILVEPLGLWPPCWRRLLELLKGAGSIIREYSAFNSQEKSTGDKNTDLARLKASLLKDTSSKEGVQGDGSLILFSPGVNWEGEEVLSSWLSRCIADNEKILFIRGRGSALQRNIFHSHCLPCLGWESRSRWRTALQILPLVVSNLWKPFDPQRLLEILTLPKSPIPRAVANYFESALREHPGIGGPLWEKAWEKALTFYAEDYKKENNRPATANIIEQFRRQMLFWIGGSRFDPIEGIPAKVLAEVCSQVSEWTASRGALDKDELLAASASMASDIAQAIEATGLDTISRPQLDRIMDSVVGAGLEHPHAYPEAAPWAQVTSPGQIWGHAPNIVWLDFISSQDGMSKSPWTSAELKALESNGIQLEDSRTKRLRTAHTWRRPFQFAEQKLVLVAPGKNGRDDFQLHPAWDEIRYLLRMQEKDERKVTYDTSSIWKSENVSVLGKALKSAPVTGRELPIPMKEWQIKDSLSFDREIESPTSMHNLIACPLSWVFKYVLRLKHGRLISLLKEAQTMGVLAHAVIGELFARSKNWTPASAKKEAEKIYDEFLPLMAAQFLHPGWEVERQRGKKTMGFAASKLVSILNEANLSVVGCEISKQKDFQKGKSFEGRIDMLLTRGKKEDFFLDLKWSGSSDYRYREAKEGQSLQLAAYSWLLTDKEAHFPPGGYYMLAQGDLFACPCSFLSGIHTVTELDLQETWNRALHAYTNRRKELGSGLVIAAGLDTEGTVDTEAESEVDSNLLILEARCKWCEYVNLCGTGIE